MRSATSKALNINRMRLDNNNASAMRGANSASPITSLISMLSRRKPRRNDD